MSENEDVTGLLREIKEGDAKAFDALFSLVYRELERVAERALARERVGHTLEPAALVNEVYLKLQGMKRIRPENRTEFFAYAAAVMRNVLVTYARKHRAGKRGGAEKNRVTLEHAGLEEKALSIDILDLNRALEKLEQFDFEMARLVELRFFSALTEAATAEFLGISRSTVLRTWRVAKQFLARELGGERDG